MESLVTTCSINEDICNKVKLVIDGLNITFDDNPLDNPRDNNRHNNRRNNPRDIDQMLNDLSNNINNNDIGQLLANAINNDAFKNFITGISGNLSDSSSDDLYSSSDDES